MVSNNFSIGCLWNGSITMVSKEREQATKVLRNYWDSINTYDRLYHETGEPTYKLQVEHLKEMLHGNHGKSKECRKINREVIM